MQVALREGWRGPAHSRRSFSTEGKGGGSLESRPWQVKRSEEKKKRAQTMQDGSGGGRRNRVDAAGQRRRNPLAGITPPRRREKHAAADNAGRALLSSKFSWSC